MRLSKKGVLRDVTEWFANPSGVPTIDQFRGIIVYEKSRPDKEGVNRIGMAVDETSKKMWWDKGDRRPTMPFTAQPSEAWSKAKAIGFAATLEEALELLFPEGVPDVH